MGARSAESSVAVSMDRHCDHSAQTARTLGGTACIAHHAEAGQSRMRAVRRASAAAGNSGWLASAQWWRERSAESDRVCRTPCEFDASIRSRGTVVRLLIRAVTGQRCRSSSRLQSEGGVCMRRARVKMQSPRCHPRTPPTRLPCPRSGHCAPDADRERSAPRAEPSRRKGERRGFRWRNRQRRARCIRMTLSDRRVSLTVVSYCYDCARLPPLALCIVVCLRCCCLFLSDRRPRC